MATPGLTSRSLAGSLSSIAPLLFAACSGDVTLPGDQLTAELRAISGDRQRGTVSSPLAAPLIVEAADAGGRLVPGASIVFRFDAGVLDGQLDPDTAITDANGRASVAVRLGSPAGAQLVVGRATQAASDDVIVRFTLNAADPPRNPDPPGGGGNGGNGGNGGGGGGGGGGGDGSGGGGGGDGGGNGHGHGHAEGHDDGGDGHGHGHNHGND